MPKLFLQSLLTSITTRIIKLDNLIRHNVIKLHCRSVPDGCVATANNYGGSITA